MLTDAVFSAISDPVRRDILVLLRSGPLSAGRIGSYFDITAAAISYHLKLLRQAGLIAEQRQKNFIFYRINPGMVEELILFLEGLLPEA